MEFDTLDIAVDLYTPFWKFVRGLDGNVHNQEIST